MRSTALLIAALLLPRPVFADAVVVVSRYDADPPSAAWIVDLLAEIVSADGSQVTVGDAGVLEGCKSSPDTCLGLAAGALRADTLYVVGSTRAGGEFRVDLVGKSALAVEEVQCAFWPRWMKATISTQDHE